MAAKVTDLFLLVKSLSRSEWSVLVRALDENAKNRRESGEEMIMSKLLYFLKDEAEYDEEKTRNFLGYGDDRRSKKTFSDLKAWAIRATFDAIERTPQNQTPESIAQKLPTLLGHLINRGLFEKANFLIDKNIQVCLDRERFDLLKQLLSFKRSTTFLLPPPELTVALSRIQELRSRAISSEAEIDYYLDLKEKLRSVKFLSVEDRQKDIRKIIGEVRMENQEFKSKKAEFHFLHTFRIVRLFQRNTPDWLSFSSRLIDHCDQNPSLLEDNEILLVYIDTKFALIRFDSMAHRFSAAKVGIDKLASSFSSLPKAKQSLVHEKRILTQIHLDRMSFNQEKGKETIAEGLKWYRENTEFTTQKGYPLFAYLSCEFLFLFENYNRCAKVLSKIRTESPSLFRPFITCAAWLLTLALRIETNDFEGLGYTLNGARKYLTKYHSNLDYPQLLLEFFERFFAAQPGKWPHLWEDMHKKLSSPEKVSGGQMIENHFQFSLWVESKATKTDFIQLVQKANKPRTSL